jgi:hypothetical protein
LYERNLATFLELNSNFIQQNSNGDASVQSAQNYTIQISNLSCVKQERYKNSFVVRLVLKLIPVYSATFFIAFILMYVKKFLFLVTQRVLFDNQERETAVRSSSMLQHTTSWDGVLTFDNVQVRNMGVGSMRVREYCMCARVFTAQC